MAGTGNRTKDAVYSFDDQTGVVEARDTADVEELVVADVKEIFDISGEISASTPLGRFVEWFTLAFANVLRINVQNSNQFLLTAAAGQQLDALALARGLERKIDTDGNEETDADLRERIQNSKEVGVGFLSAIKIALDQVEGVRSSMVVENNTNAELTVAGVDAMAPHSIFVCADYDDTLEDEEDNIASAVFTNRPCGTGYTRFEDSSYEIEKSVADAFGNEYKVYFYKPEKKTVKLALKVNNRAYAGADIEGDIRSAVRTWFTSRKYKVGETVLATEIEDGIESLVPGIVVLASITNDGGTDADTFSSATLLEVPASHIAAASADDSDIAITVISRG